MNKHNIETREIYYRVVKIAKVFVENRLFLTVNIIQDLKPSTEELAKIAERISNLISEIGSDFSDINMAINAKQCSIDLHRLAKAVQEKDEQNLQSILGELEKYTTGPY